MTDKNTLDLARVFAESVESRPSAYNEQARAAADLISSLLDQWVDAEKLREVVADHHIDMSEELMEALGALLPAPTPPTLADMIPEERAECQWMQAEVDGRVYEGRAVITDIVEAEGKAKTILPSGQQFSFHISIVTPLPDLPRMEWPGNEPGNVQVNRMDGLARTGETSPAETSDNRRSSTARTHPESAAPAPASPRPEDVPVGEPWQVEVYGQAAIGYRNDPEDIICWTVVYRDEANFDWMFDSEVTLIARLVPETTKQDNETAFDPAYTYSDRHGDVWHYEEEEWWCYQQGDRTFRATGTPPAEYGPYTRIEA